MKGLLLFLVSKVRCQRKELPYCRECRTSCRPRIDKSEAGCRVCLGFNLDPVQMACFEFGSARSAYVCESREMGIFTTWLE